MYKNNPKYKLAEEINGYRLYLPLNISDYHKSREVEAMVQNTYANSGITPEYLKSLCDEAIKMLENDPKNENLRANMLAVFNQIAYRTKYPVDGLCAVRMGAILTFIEWEDEDKTVTEPEIITYPWIKKKIDLALDANNWELYNFFFHMGFRNTEAYLNHLEVLNDPVYLEKRNEIIQSFYPLPKE